MRLELLVITKCSSERSSYLVYSLLNCDYNSAISTPKQLCPLYHERRGETEAWSTRNQPLFLIATHRLTLCILKAVSLLVSVAGMGVRHSEKRLIVYSPGFDRYLDKMAFTTLPARRIAFSHSVISAAGAFPPIHILIRWRIDRRKATHGLHASMIVASFWLIQF